MGDVTTEMQVYGQMGGCSAGLLSDNLQIWAWVAPVAKDLSDVLTAE